MNNHWNKETYNQNYPSRPYQEKIYGCIAHIKYFYEYNTIRQRKTR